MFHGTFVSNKNGKSTELHEKPVYLGLSTLELSKLAMYEFWYDYVWPKYEERAKLCYIDTDSFIVYIKTDHTYKDIAKDFETRFDTSNYQLDRPIPKEKKKIVSLVKNELGKKIMKEFLGLRTETSSYLIDGGSVDKKAKCTK